MQNGPWYNTTICSWLSGHNFEYCLTTGSKYGYELLCDGGEHDRMHPSSTDDGSSGSVRPFPSTSSIDALVSLGHTIDFIKNWLQFSREICASRKLYTNRRCKSYSIN